MNQTILYSLFLDNPKIPEQVTQFCQSLPEYRKAAQEYNEIMEEVFRDLPYPQFCRFEERLNHFWTIENQAYYLFGLGLREEVLQALGQAM